jgi:hypothetical protein
MLHGSLEKRLCYLKLSFLVVWAATSTPKKLPNKHFKKKSCRINPYLYGKLSIIQC